MKIDKPVIKEYPYRAGRGLSIVLLLLVTGGLLLTGFLALHADRGANLKGFELSAGQFRAMMGTVAVLGAVIALPLMTWLVVDSFAGNRRIAFTVDSVILPKPDWSGMSTDEVELPFEEILGVQLGPYMGRTQAIQVVYDNGFLMIPGNMLRRADFVEVGEWLYSVVPGREREGEAADE